MTTTVVHCKRESYDVYIGRPSKWGNPFEIGKDGDREEVIKKYREWITMRPELMGALPELKDKILGCWCSPHSCHGDILAELADGERSGGLAKEIRKDIADMESGASHVTESPIGDRGEEAEDE